MDPGTVLGVVSLVWDVSKDLYSYYSLWKNSDGEVKALRARLLSIFDACRTVEQTLQRHQFHNVDLSQANDAIRECREAAETLKGYLRTVKPDDILPPGLRTKLKAQGRKLLYPFRKADIDDLTDDVLACRDALHFVLDVLGIELEAQTLETLQELDGKLNKRFDNVIAAIEQSKDAQILSLVSLDNELRQINTNVEAGHSRSISEIKTARDSINDRISQSQSNHEIDKRVNELAASLSYPEMNFRRNMITDAHAETCQWLFTESHGLDAENTMRLEIAQRLRTWLKQATTDLEQRIFWIRGKAGSGKSSFVKFIRDQEQTSSLLREWAGNSPVIVIEHYFWVAGSLLEKSILGFLQHSLHQLLKADSRATLTIIEGESSENAIGKAPWTINRLWGCLAKIIGCSSHYICFFVDGLDEAHPDKDHADLVRRLKQLSSINDNIKLLLSSRPWPAFEREFTAAPIITMEAVNRGDIVRYTTSRLGATSEDFVFNDAEVDGIVNARRWFQEVRPEPQHMIKDIADKADGVFLWTSLVLDGLCERIQAGETIQSVRAHIDDFPPEVEQYIEQLVYARIHSTWASQTAMTLHIMMAEEYCPLHYFWMVYNSEKSNPGSLITPGFVGDIPDMTDDASAAERIERQTRQFLSMCCKDLIQIGTPLGNIPELLDDLSVVSFSHRTIFDFLLTERMQRLVRTRLPVTFEDKFFMKRVEIAALKVGPSTVGSLFQSLRIIFLLKPIRNHSDDRIEDRSETIRDRRAFPVDLVLECEKLALNTLDRCPKFDWDVTTIVMIVSIVFVKYGCPALIDRIVKLHPSISCTEMGNGGSSSHAVPPLFFALGLPAPPQNIDDGIEQAWDLGLLRKLLVHGANPAQCSNYLAFYGYGFRGKSSNLFACLLQHFEHFIRMRECGLPLVHFGWIRQVIDEVDQADLAGNGIRVSQYSEEDISPEEGISPEEDLSPEDFFPDHVFPIRALPGFSEDSLADAVKLLIEYGADLRELIPLNRFTKDESGRGATFVQNGESMTTREIIEKRIPFAQTSHWQTFLDEYSTDQKREEIAGIRRERIKYWPLARLGDTDAEMLGLSVSKLDDCWPDRKFGDIADADGNEVSYADVESKGELWKFTE